MTKNIFIYEQLTSPKLIILINPYSEGIDFSR